jgi:hypothetical protein
MFEQNFMGSKDYTGYKGHNKINFTKFCVRLSVTYHIDMRSAVLQM